LKHSWLWRGIGAGLLLAVVYLSLTPDPIETPPMEEFDLGHFAAYFTLMLWWAQLVPPGWPRVVLAAGLAAMGVGLEFAQALTPYRSFDVADMRDNALGVAAGFALVLTPLGGALAAVERWLERAAG
jgi:VanZ family protein